MMHQGLQNVQSHQMYNMIPQHKKTISGPSSNNGNHNGSSNGNPQELMNLNMGSSMDPSHIQQSVPQQQAIQQQQQAVQQQAVHQTGIHQPTHHMGVSMMGQYVDETGGQNLTLSGQKRRYTTSCLSMKTVARWRLTGDVNLEHLFGCSETCSYDEKCKADDLLRESGQLVCVLCNSAISANKKAVRRHQVKNRNHLNLLSQLASGAHVIDRNSVMTTANSPRLRPMVSKTTIEKHLPMTIPTNSDPLQTALAKEAWEIIANQEKVIDMPQLASVINSLGISETKDLMYCDEKEIIQIGMLVKKVPRRRFFQIFGMNPDFGAELTLDGDLERDVAAALDEGDDDKAGHSLLQQAHAHAQAQAQAHHQHQQHLQQLQHQHHQQQQQQHQQQQQQQQYHHQVQQHQAQHQAQQHHLLNQQLSSQDGLHYGPV